MIRLYVLIVDNQWAVTLTKQPITPSPNTTFSLIAEGYRDEENATRGMGRLGLLLMQKAVANPTLDTRDIVIAAVDEFKRQRMAI